MIISKLDFPTNNKPPSVVLLGGGDNSLSIVRSLGKRGISVKVSAKENCFASFSRFCHKNYLIPEDVEADEYWRDLLLSRVDSELSGSVIFACNDDAVEFVTENDSVLKKNYILETQDKTLRSAMLNKQKTFELGKAMGIPTPNFWKSKLLRMSKRFKTELSSRLW